MLKHTASWNKHSNQNNMLTQVSALSQSYLIGEESFNIEVEAVCDDFILLRHVPDDNAGAGWQFLGSGIVKGDVNSILSGRHTTMDVLGDDQ